MNPLSDPTSPYFLHPGETPGLVLISCPLMETNYHMWSRAMAVALEGKNKVGFIDGSISEPLVGDPLKPVWNRNNKIILSWLMQSLTNEIAQSDMLHDRASKLWSKLKQSFSQRNHTRITNFNEELYSMR